MIDPAVLITRLWAAVIFAFDRIRTELTISSTSVVRYGMVIYLLVAGIWMSLLSNWVRFPSLEVHAILWMPRSAWASAYIVVGCLQLWRLLDPRPRIAAAFVINGAMTALMAINALALIAIGDPAGTGSVVGFLFSVWITLRTGWTAIDKARA